MILTLPDVKQWLEGMYLALGRPAPAATVLRMADVWYQRLKDLQRHHVKRAFEEAQKEDRKYFPSVEHIMSLARRYELTAARAQAQDSGEDICPGCHHLRYYAGFMTGAGAVLPRLRCECPSYNLSPNFNHPDALAWVEHDPALMHLQPKHRRGEAA
jgi:hypothetical protein